MRYKRILNEMNRLPYTVVCPPDTESDLMLEVPHLNVRLRIREHYPFQAPILYANNVDYVTVFLTRYASLRKALSRYDIRVPCPCCHHIACSWSPVFGIAEMVAEYARLECTYTELERLAMAASRLPFDDNVTSQVLSYLV